MHTSERLNRLATAPTLIAILVLTGLWGVFFWRLLTPVAEDRVIFPEGDFPLHYFSYSDYQVARLGDGDIPLWNPYNYGGDPFAANVQWAVWYPPRLIAALVVGPGDWDIEALQLEVAVHYLLASLMMWAFLRVLIKRNFPALVGSILWTYGGYLAGYPMLQPSILYAIVWLPLMLLGAHLSLTNPNWRIRGILLSGVMMAISFFGGHTQTTMQMTYFTGAYLLFVGWQRGLRWRDLLGRVALLGIAGATLAAVQLLPAVELTRLSFRAEDYYYPDKSTGFTVPELMQFLWPHLFGALWWPLYMGVAGLLLALGTLLRVKKRHWFWIGTILVGLTLALGGNAVVYDVFYIVVPGVSFFREQERAASLAIFALVVLAADQVAWMFPAPDEWPDSTRAPIERRFAWLAHGHLALVWIVSLVVIMALVIQGDDTTLPEPAPEALGLVAWVSLLFTLWLIWWQRQDAPAARHAIPIALVLLIVFDLFSFGMNSPNFVPDTPENRIAEPDFIDILRQPSEDIQWHVDGGAGIQTYGTYWRIPDIYGTGPFSLASTEKLRRIRVDRRWEIFAVRYATMTAALPDNVPAESIGTGVNYDGQEYTLYELSDPRPFAHLVFAARSFEDPDAARNFMINEPHINLREIALVAGDLPVALPPDPPIERPAGARVDGFHMTIPEYMEMAVSTPQPALLTLPVANYPGWVATVNDQDVELVDTYGGLIGIPIPPGENMKVTLAFRPQSVIVGALISALALVAVVGYALVVVWMNRQRRSPGNESSG